VLAAPEGTSEVDYYMDKRFGDRSRGHLAPGAIAPVNTMIMEYTYEPKVIFDQPEPPKTSITRVFITDAAGYQWEMRSGRAGPARRVQRWWRWWWKRHGDL
jgi:hypothetical protein